MKCHLLTANEMHRFGTNSIDEVAEVPDGVAKDLIARGIACEEGKLPKSKAKKPETATGPGGSNAGGKANLEPPKG